MDTYDFISGGAAVVVRMDWKLPEAGGRTTRLPGAGFVQLGGGKTTVETTACAR